MASTKQLLLLQLNTTTIRNVLIARTYSVLIRVNKFRNTKFYFGN